MPHKIIIIGVAVTAGLLGIAIGFFGQDLVNLQSHSECIDEVESQIALKDLADWNSFVASTKAQKACDKRHEKALDFGDESDLRTAMRVSTSLRFGENGVHQLIIDNNTTNFIITNLEIEMKFTDASYQGKVSAETGYIRIQPKTTDNKVEVKTNLFDTNDIENNDFSYRVVKVWGVESSG
ncbi:hypothetical protein SAMN04487962_1089 [Marinobacter segnicrescens]|uniref:Uncharacterized protein n=1 Tax=Marinobacter segnicrescens TaxID=430453 RepID=A0A1I0DT66_9GAMM|nr:hypothetical protein [Marinobacter segnicrescens]SET35607.1 hypothetical protein SAMN04487962_1089 [Marinobacter segnicrescens]